MGALPAAKLQEVMTIGNVVPGAIVNGTPTASETTLLVNAYPYLMPEIIEPDIAVAEPVPKHIIPENAPVID